ncbi:MAG: DUF2269 domain-containing protein [Methyloversatilis discipulorum]|uniref:DUF2269 family protein n=1 Tax=Methyloversatilis discipulorum TaxID=1119528 RepID=UPI0026EDBC00|nr:DUF2269 domain-containing protein [Methyloversatilis discipulorum]MBT9516771.1 DUF2269 domain-containing protein [Methyloversatilis discipulorum]
MDYSTLKFLHVLSAIFLFGTGVGSAFYLFFTTLNRDVAPVVVVSRLVVVADFVFTATTAIVQPVTGLLLARRAGIPLDTGWLAGSIALYALAIACWLPVVRLQIRMRDLAATASSMALPSGYWKCFRCWVALGVPALLAFIAITYLMVAKPF